MLTDQESSEMALKKVQYLAKKAQAEDELDQMLMQADKPQADQTA